MEPKMSEGGYSFACVQALTGVGSHCREGIYFGSCSVAEVRGKEKTQHFFLMRAQLDHLTGKISELEIRSQTYS